MADTSGVNAENKCLERPPISRVESPTVDTVKYLDFLLQMVREKEELFLRAKSLGKN